MELISIVPLLSIGNRPALPPTGLVSPAALGACRNIRYRSPMRYRSPACQSPGHSSRWNSWPVCAPRTPLSTAKVICSDDSAAPDSGTMRETSVTFPKKMIEACRSRLGAMASICCTVAREAGRRGRRAGPRVGLCANASTGMNARTAITNCERRFISHSTGEDGIAILGGRGIKKQ